MNTLLRCSGLPTAALLLLTGCSSGRVSAVEDTAGRFGSAWESGDGAGVCDLLAPATRDEVVTSTGKPCEAGVLEEDLTSPGQLVSVAVWGDAAQVRAARDTVFLARFDSGWKVTAAGCTPQRGKPYDCQVQGG